MSNSYIPNLAKDILIRTFINMLSFDILMWQLYNINSSRYIKTFNT